MIRRMDRDDVPGRWSEGLFSPAIRGVVRTIEICSNSRRQYEDLQELRRPELSGHENFESMLVYTHVLNRLQGAVASENGRIIRADRSA